MKKRIISAVVALLIFVPLFLNGGLWFNAAILFLGILGLKEAVEIRETKRKFPFIIKFISFLLLSLIILNNVDSNELVLSLDFKYISLLILGLFLPIVFYKNKELYNFMDSLYLTGFILILGIVFNLFILLRAVDLNVLIYLFVITVATDTYAYISGSLSGRHKLIPSISPKKTVEGFVIGTVFGTFIACAFYYIKIDDQIALNVLIVVTFVLSLISQFGDLIFSSVKRYYNKKDFSNLMPGHGGILDRLDSIIFVVLTYLLFVSFM